MFFIWGKKGVFMKYKMALFGETERGQFKTPYKCHSLDQLVDYFGNPPPDTHGIEFAIQALSFKYELIFFRVKQEGYSTDDYLYGIKYLEQRYKESTLDAIGLPGVGDYEILDATINLINRFKTILVISEKDLYDYVTSRC